MRWTFLVKQPPTDHTFRYDTSHPKQFKTHYPLPAPPTQQINTTHHQKQTRGDKENRSLSRMPHCQSGINSEGHIELSPLEFKF